MDAEVTLPDADVIVCTHSLDRWRLLVRAVESVLAQAVLPKQLIIAVDHNDELVQRCRAEWCTAPGTSPVEVIVAPNRFAGRKGSNVNTAILHTRAEIVVLLDDDAQATADWLRRLLMVYATHPEAVAVGGAPLPDYEGPRPSWFPPDYDWILGCHYGSMPTELAPVRRLIGTCLSVRRDAILEIGGWCQDDHDDMDVSQRLSHRYGSAAVLYEPRAEVLHFVPADRMTWAYFWRRCYYTNQRKPSVLADMDKAASMRAELQFATHVAGTFPAALLAMLQGRPWRLIHSLIAVVGLGLAGVGYTIAKVKFVLGRRVEPVGKTQNRSTSQAAARLTTSLSAADIERARAGVAPDHL